MNPIAALRSFSASHVLLAAALAGLCLPALASNGLEHAKKRNKLVAGVHHVLPEYKGGMKFRTAEAIDTELVQDLAKRWQLASGTMTVRAEPGKHVALLASGNVDVILAAIPDNDPLYRSATVIPTGYSAGPMAIMRNDTSIKTWAHLKGRKVCVSEGGQYVGTLAAKYGAVEQVKKAPADSLLAVRVGECDAAVHDNTMLEELIKLPEWKKFSARLPVGPRSTLAFVVPSSDTNTAAALRQVAKDWSSSGLPDQLVKKAVKHIAFEVYLDQEVPDCH